MIYLIFLFLGLIFIANINPKRTVLGLFYVDWTEKLQATRMWLKDVNAQINDPSNYERMTGTLNYMFSGINPRAINTKMLDNSGNEEYRPVEVRYIPHKGTGNLITDDSNGTCSKVAQRRDKIQLIQPTLYCEDKFTINEDYVRQNSENGYKLQNRLNKEFKDSMRICRESINAQILAKLAGLFGSNPAAEEGAGGYFDIDAIIGSSGKIDDTQFDIIKIHQEDNFMANGSVSIIGLGNARRYMNRLAVGNANDAGIDYRIVSDDFGMLLWKDSDAAAALGATNRTLAIYPGMTQFFQYNLFRGEFALKISETYIKGTMADPIFPGITYDYTLRYDDNCTNGNGLQGSWIGRILTYFDVYNVPEDAFGDVYGDLNDFNGILGYTFNES